MDNIDKKILALLKNDARTSVSEISRNVHLSRTAVQERIHRLEKNKVITGYTITHTHGTISAIILLQHRARRKISTIISEHLKCNPNVRECFLVTGGYDMLIIVECNELMDIDDIITSIDNLQESIDEKFFVETITYPIIKRL